MKQQSDNTWYLDNEINISTNTNISIQFGPSNITKKEMRIIIPKLNTISKTNSTSIEIFQDSITIFEKKAYLNYICDDNNNRSLLCCIEDKINGYYFIYGPSQEIKIYYYNKEKLNQMRKITNILELIPSQFKQSGIEPNVQTNIQVNSNEELAYIFANIIENAPEYINKILYDANKKTKIKRR